MHSRNPTHEELMWILLYADDISLVCDDIDNLRTAIALMDSTFLQWGLTISTEKTKVLVVGRDAEVQTSSATVIMRGDTLEVISGFKYLGSIFTSNSDGTLDASASSASARLRQAKIWLSNTVNQNAILSVNCHVGLTVWG